MLLLVGCEHKKRQPGQLLSLLVGRHLWQHLNLHSSPGMGSQGLLRDFNGDLEGDDKSDPELLVLRGV